MAVPRPHILKSNEIWFMPRLDAENEHWRNETYRQKADQLRSAAVVADPAAARWPKRGVHAVSTCGRLQTNPLALARANSEAG
jgi:hypothetical protein